MIVVEVVMAMMVVFGGCGKDDDDGGGSVGRNGHCGNIDIGGYVDDSDN